MSAGRADDGYVPPIPTAVWAFRRYFRRLAARQFNTIRLRDLHSAHEWPGDLPTLFLGNHPTWWDGILAWLLMVDLGFTPHVLMEATNLARYRPFRWIGALPLRRDPPRAAWDDLQRAQACLRPGSALWIFPQGHRKPALQRPVQLERGAAQLALGVARRLRVVPVAFRYPFLSEQQPEACLFVGESMIVEPGRAEDRRRLGDEFAARLLATIDALDARLACEDLRDFRVFVEGSPSINKRMDRVRHRLGLLRGPFEERNG